MKSELLLETDIESQILPSTNLSTSTSSEASIFDYAADLKTVLELCEVAELRLSYSDDQMSEASRRGTGSYYTPSDVSEYFWDEFFKFADISNKKSATEFARNFHFIEPAAGAGVLIFSLLLKLLDLGVDPEEISRIDIDIVDINGDAVSFIKQQFDWLSNEWEVNFTGVKFLEADFLQLQISYLGKPCMFFGNPPFVSSKKLSSKWKNIFADFIEAAIIKSAENGIFQFIVPLSISFSRDYIKLRRDIINKNRSILLSHFDNIPDTLFKVGKPENNNTNKANSQRCTFLTSIPSKNPTVKSSRLIRWSKKDRNLILSKSPKYYDVTKYSFDNQIPRPENEYILNYLDKAAHDMPISDLISKNGDFFLRPANVARNFIGIREANCVGAHEFRFEKKDDFLCAFYIIASDLFFSYWLTVGDGFHVTKSNILNFPISAKVIHQTEIHHARIERLWNFRKAYEKSKQNAGSVQLSYDFTGALPSLL